jgi:hypothetical protein
LEEPNINADKCCSIKDAYILDNSHTGTDIKLLIAKGCEDCNLDFEYTITDVYDNLVFSGGQTGSYIRDFRERDDNVDIFALNAANTYEKGIFGGVARVKLPEFLSYGGKYTVNFKLMSDGKVFDSLTKEVDIATKADISELVVDKNYMHGDDTVDVSLEVKWSKCTIAYFEQQTVKKPNPMAAPIPADTDPEIEKTKMHKTHKDTRNFQNILEQKFANPEECEAHGEEYEEYRQKVMSSLILPSAMVEVSLIDSRGRTIDKNEEPIEFFVAAKDEEKILAEQKDISAYPLLTDVKGRRIINETPSFAKIVCTFSVANENAIKIFAQADLKINGHVIKRLVSPEMSIAIEG